MPKTMDDMASVIMKGGTRKTATPIPLTTPMPVPAPKPARQANQDGARGGGATVPKPPTMVIDVMTETSANMTPTERSRARGQQHDHLAHGDHGQIGRLARDLHEIAAAQEVVCGDREDDDRDEEEPGEHARADEDERREVLRSIQ